MQKLIDRVTFLIFFCLILGTISTVICAFDFSEKPLVISTEKLQTGRFDREYKIQLCATGGKKPYIWNLTSGTLPKGLYFDNSSGEISGLPKEYGLYELSFMVTDANNYRKYKNYVLEIIAPLAIITEKVPDTQPNFLYVRRIEAQGGKKPYKWHVVDGKLPDGIELDANGVLIGKTSEVGKFSFVVRLTAIDEQQFAKQFTFSVINPDTKLTIKPNPKKIEVKSYTKIIPKNITNNISKKKTSIKIIPSNKNRVIAKIDGINITRADLDAWEKECSDFMRIMPKTFGVTPRLVKIAKFTSEEQKISYIKAVKEICGIKNRFTSNTKDAQLISATKKAIKIHQKETEELYMAFRFIEEKIKTGGGKNDQDSRFRAR